jgi:hypothetical protein
MSRKRYWEDEGRARYWEDMDRVRYRYDEDEDILPSSFVSYPSNYETLSPQLREQLEPMKAALQQMINDAQTEKDTTREAINGEPLATEVGRYTYQFTVKTQWSVDENTKIYIQLNRITKERIQARVVTLVGTLLTLVTKQPIPDDLLNHLTLIEDTTWLLKRQRDALTYHLRETEAHFGSKVLGYLPLKYGRVQLRGKLGTFVPNKQQKRAIEHALGSEVTIVNGPGGTGKSAVLANASLRFMKKDLSILAASHTNIATDNMFIQQVQAFEASGDKDLLRLLAEGRIVRAGDPRHPSLLFGAYRHLTVEAVARQRISNHDESRVKLEQEMQSKTGTIEKLERALSQQESDWHVTQRQLQPQIDTLRSDLALLEAQERDRIKSIDDSVNAQEEKRKAAEAQITSLQQRQDNLQQLISRWQSYRNEVVFRAVPEERNSRNEQLKQVQKSLSEMQEKWDNRLAAMKWFGEQRHEAKVKAAQNEIAALQASVAEVDQAISALSAKLRQNMSAQLPPQAEVEQANSELKRLQEARLNTYYTAKMLSLRQELEPLERAMEVGESALERLKAELKRKQSEKARIEAQLDELKTCLADMKAQVVSEAQLVATTISSLYLNPTLMEQEYDVVMIDEISMISLIGVLLAVSHARKHVMVAGDTMQLAPVLKTECKERDRKVKMPEAVKWLGEDLLTHLEVTIFDAIEGRKGCVLLTEQGRTHPKILAPLNHYVYQDMLTSRAATEYAPPISPLPDCPLMVVDSSLSPDSRTHKPHPKEARVNDHHIDVVVALVQQIVATLPERSPLVDPSVPRIGVLVPYRSQSRRMSRALRKANLAKDVHVGTIHTAQALEFEVVILDTIEAPGYEPFEFTCDLMLDDRGMATGATRLLTVGHGRAKCKLIYIAHVTHLRLYERKRNPKNDPHKQSLLIGLVN